MKSIFVGAIAMYASLVLANPAFCAANEADAEVNGFDLDHAVSPDPLNFGFNTGNIIAFGTVDASTGNITNGLGNASASGSASAGCTPGSGNQLECKGYRP